MLNEQKISRWEDGYYVYWVAWHNIRDWVIAYGE
jgi:hypothetical protein